MFAELPAVEGWHQDGPGVYSLPVSDPSKILLDRYHRLSTGFFSLEIAAALLMLFATAKLLAARRAMPVGVPKPKEAVKVLDL